MKNNSILVISNNKEIGSEIVEKIKLLRDCDTIRVVTYIESISVLNSTQPSMILLYCANSDSVGIVKEIRSLKFLDKVPIIFITDVFQEDLLVYAFDNGIDDYFFMSDPDSIVLIRILLTLQKTVLYKRIDTDKEIFVNAGIVDKDTGIYKKEHASSVLRNIFAKSIEENSDDSFFLYIKPVLKSGGTLDLKSVGNAVKNVLRGDDILAFARNDGFYAVLTNSEIKGAKALVSRIRSKLSEICDIYAVCAQITASFEQTEPVLFEEMKSAITSDTSFTFIPDIEIGEMSKSIDIQDENGKNFKSFQKEFFENIDKIVSPAYKAAKGYIENKYKDFDVDFNITESESGFYVKNGKSECEFVISYPTYIKLIVDVKQQIKGHAPVIRRAVYDLDGFSADKLSTVLKDVLDEFAAKTIEDNKKIR